MSSKGTTARSRPKAKSRCVKVAKSKPAARPAEKRVATAAKSVPARGAGQAVDAAATKWSLFLKNGGVDPLKVARDLGITKADLAETLGLPADALMRGERIMADKTQARLTEFLEILSRVEAWSGGLSLAFAWYRSQGIAALGDETAEAMVKTNRAGYVRTYLNAIAAGGFA